MRPEDGKLVPLVTIDTTERPDIAELLAAYTPETVGDVAVQWGQREGAPHDTVTLFLKFTAPQQLLVIFDFEIVRQGIIVDEILRSRELYFEGHRRMDGSDTIARDSIRKWRAGPH